MRLVHMRDAASEALQFVSGITREQFQTERMRQRAVTNCVQEIGEAAARTSDESRARVPSLPWPKIVGMRHILVHSYFDIDVGAIWRVVVNELPELVRVIDAALSVWPVATTSVPLDRRPVMGVDGCPAGWCAFVGESAAHLQFHVFADLASLWSVGASCRLVLIDVPIGLPDTKRQCDLEARSRLGAEGQSRVFPAPPRAAVYADTYAEAKRRSQRAAGFLPSIQAWNIFGKIREVDTWLRQVPGARAIIRECHPEVCFWGLSGHTLPSKHGRKHVPGSKHEALARRTQVLDPFVPDINEVIAKARMGYPRSAVSDDDILDALVATVTAMAPPELLRTLPETPTRDDESLAIEMVYRVRK